MRYGICTSPRNLSEVEAAGFDYAEFSLNGITAMPEADFEALAARIGVSRIKPETTNCFFPGEMRLVGPEADTAAIEAYIAFALARAARLGVRIAVIGSGGSRRVPDGVSLEEGTEQFRDVLRRIGEAAAPLGILAAIEPLNAAETNLVLSVREGIALTRAVDHPHVKLLADFYHMRRGDDAFESLTGAQGMLRHVHIANSTGRAYPSCEGEDAYQAFFDMLVRMGYDERVSIEASTDCLAEDGPRALALLRRLESSAREGRQAGKD